MTEGNETVGYTISFRLADPITIYNGAKGTDGETPQIGLTQAEDDNWYWTLNGELLTDADNNPIRANGQDRVTAPTPQILLGSNIPTAGTIQTDNGEIILHLLQSECLQLADQLAFASPDRTAPVRFSDSLFL